MSKRWRQTSGLRALRHSLALSTLTACTIAQPATTTTTTPTQTPSPIIQAVKAGASTTVATPTGPVSVTITSSYISAEGQQCRTYSLTAPGALPTQNLACDTGATWQPIPPLAVNANPASPQ